MVSWPPYLKPFWAIIFPADNGHNVRLLADWMNTGVFQGYKTEAHLRKKRKHELELRKLDTEY
jgi:hypothetical protein